MNHDDQGYQLLGDDEIIQAVIETNTSDAVENDMEDIDDAQEGEHIPSHGEVVHMLTKCLPWVEQQPETTAQHMLFSKI